MFTPLEFRADAPSSSSSASPALLDEIRALKQQLNAVILAHYYQEGEVQDVADFIGDSLDLSRKAAATDADVIVFCGVRFMAEVAKILSPQKTVLLPDMEAGCSLESGCLAADFKAFRDAHPDHLALTYINCSAEVKALSDIIVTSTNAEKIIRQIPENQPIIFAPDQHLGRYLSKKTGRDMLLWNGSCLVHEQFSERALLQMIGRYPNARVIAHPECPEALLAHAHHIGSTSSLLRYTEEHPGQEFIVLTEPGIIHQMIQRSPNSQFYPVPGMDESCQCNNCPFMKLNTLQKLRDCMKHRTPRLEVEETTRQAAERALTRMLAMS
jgi:quinolinate synthase